MTPTEQIAQLETAIQILKAEAAGKSSTDQTGRTWGGSSCPANASAMAAATQGGEKQSKLIAACHQRRVSH